MPDGALPGPAVPPERYDADYYLRRCAGSDEWSASDGAEAAPVYAGCLDRAAFRPGEVVVDIGTGRGELLAVAVERGAARAIGVEYAPVAVDLARQTLERRGVADRAEVVLCDARAIPLPDGEADLVTLLDVVEHLAPAELDASLSEARRLLRRGGRVLIHTLPNRSIYEVTYRTQRARTRHRRATWPADPRNDDERTMHVNEQTITSLGRALRRGGFRPARASLGEWIYTDHVPEPSAARLYHRLARLPLLARFGVANIWGEGTKP